MANICSNHITVSGNEENVKSFMAEIAEMRDNINQNGDHSLPKYVTDKGGKRTFRELYIDDEIGIFSSTTNWTPPLDEMKIMAEHHGVNIEMDYEELGCGVYGKWTFVDGEENDIYLDEVDFAKVFWREEEEDYIFEGKEYESDSEPLEILLERKIKGSTTPIPPKTTDTSAVESAFNEMLGNPIAEIDGIIDSLKPLQREFEKSFARAEDLILQSKKGDWVERTDETGARSYIPIEDVTYPEETYGLASETPLDFEAKEFEGAYADDDIEN